MAGDTDAVLTKTGANFDININGDGDIETDDFFDTSILYSLFGERRANEDEVTEARLRRGWIGNEGKDFENGSKLWLFQQARLTRTNLSRIEDEARKALQWLVDDGFAIAIEDVIAAPGVGLGGGGGVQLIINIRRTRDIVEPRLFNLWQNTGIR